MIWLFLGSEKGQGCIDTTEIDHEHKDIPALGNVDPSVRGIILSRVLVFARIGQGLDAALFPDALA